MGDISTHAQIANKIMGVLGKPADAIFFELGNWLTDMSQFRDPTAFIGGKIAVWDKAPWGSSLSNLKLYLNSLMGWPKVNGALSRYLRHVAFAVGCERFRKQGIEPDEFEEIFRDCWTQYYPHEHLDFPPWPIDDVIGDRTASGIVAHMCKKPPPKPSANACVSGGGQARKLLNYQEMQLLYLAEVLTAIDVHWRNLRADKDSDSNRKTLHRVLARFGHASHALEDFYFHSNFVEIAWSRLGRELPGAEKTVRNRRIWHRRVRAPKARNKRELSHKDSAPGLEVVFTGSFGSADMFHTVADALEGMTEKLQPKMIEAREAAAALEHSADALKALATPLLRGYAALDDTLGWLVFEDRRHQLREESRREEVVIRHHSRLRDGTYTKIVNELAAAKVLHTKSKEAILNALRVDQELAFDPAWEEGAKLPKRILGTYGFLLEMLVTADEEHEKSIKASEALDAKNVTADEETFNGATAENIGSHSLMSKDSVRKLPLRQQAINVSCAVCGYMAELMVREVQGRPSAAPRHDTKARKAPRNEHVATLDTHGPVDWLHFLQHFVCHPDECEAQWHVAALDDPAAPVHQSHTIRYVEAADREDRLKEQTRVDLEQAYKALEPQLETKWKAA